MSSLTGVTAMSGATVSGTVTKSQTSIAQLRVLYELTSLFKRSCREFRAIMNLMFTTLTEQTWFSDFTSEPWILMLCDYLHMEDTGLVLTNLEIMLLLISFRNLKGMKGSDWVAGHLSLNEHEMCKILERWKILCLTTVFLWLGSSSGQPPNQEVCSQVSYSLYSHSVFPVPSHEA